MPIEIMFPERSAIPRPDAANGRHIRRSNRILDRRDHPGVDGAPEHRPDLPLIAGYVDNDAAQQMLRGTAYIKIDPHPLFQRRDSRFLTLTIVEGKIVREHVRKSRPLFLIEDRRNVQDRG